MTGRVYLKGLAISCAAGFFALQGQATVVINYPDFSNSTGLTFQGAAGTAGTGSGTVLRVTPAAFDDSGAAYSTTPVTLGPSDTFSTTFEFQFTDPAGWDPADGITFVLASNPSGLGGNGVGIGYAGVPNSVALEFDTYNNGGNDGNSSNHVAIDAGGHVNDGTGDANLVNVYNNPSCGFPSGGIPNQNNYLTSGCMSNGDIWSVTISYNGSSLSASMWDKSGTYAEASPFTVYSSLPLDIAADLGTNTAYVGFTAGTGAGDENHDILNWQFADTTQLGNPTPEPATFGMLFGALLLLPIVKRAVVPNKATRN